MDNRDFSIDVAHLLITLQERQEVDGKATQIISLSAARPRSGKDSVAEDMKKILGGGVYTLAFATKLRSHVEMAVDPYRKHIKQPFRELSSGVLKDTVMLELCPRNVNAAEYRSFLLDQLMLPEDMPLSPRQHLQFYGNDFVKGFRGMKGLWVDLMAQELWYTVTYRNPKLIIITDTRSPNEYDFLRDIGATFVKVEREGFPMDYHDYAMLHEVETHGNSFTYDHVIVNRFGEEESRLNDVAQLLKTLSITKE